MKDPLQELQPPLPRPSQTLEENTGKIAATVLRPPPPKRRPRRMGLSPAHSPRAAASSLGMEAEAAVVQSISDQGWRVLERNFRRRRGEIDIIALDGDTLVFIEVKARSSELCGHGAEALTGLKRSRIRRTALGFLAKHPHQGPIRFDVIYLDAETNHLEHLRDAFSE